jgi:hypothetical protein
MGFMTKDSPNWRRCLWVAGLALLLGGLAARSPGQPKRPLYSTNKNDREECEVNLGLIYEAIQEYRRRHQQKLPDRLSDLLPDLLPNANVLFCPFVLKSSDPKSWRAVRYVGGSDPRTSYGYEFCLEQLSPISEWRGVPKTQRDKKESQMKRLGCPVVPIVRCLAHRPYLNLAYNGQIYESGVDWESKFRDLVEAEELWTTRMFADRRVRKQVAPEDFPVRPPQASSMLLDLTTHYNALLADSWQGFPGDTLAGLPIGLQTFGGVPFDVRGLIQMHVHWLPAGFPKNVEGIKVSQKCRVIHFLHGTAFGPLSQLNLARYFIHYMDRQVREIPIVYGQNIGDWWFDPKNPFEPTEAKVVWTGTNDAAKAYGRSVRLFLFTAKNPLADVPIDTISMASSAEDSALFLIAVTVE